MESEKTKIKENLGKKIIELNLLDSKIKELDQNLAILEKQISELQACQLSLDELKNTKKDSEMLAPIIPGIFAKTKLLNNSELLVDIGAKTLVKKNIDETKKIIQKKIDQSTDVHEKLIAEINLIAQNMNKLEKEIRKNSI